jgi:hypothetical protein
MNIHVCMYIHVNMYHTYEKTDEYACMYACTREYVGMHIYVDAYSYLYAKAS